MRRNLCAPALVLALFLIGAPAATADTITGGVGAAWQTWVVANLDQDNKPYWDGNSWDSSLPMNIGSWLPARRERGGRVCRSRAGWAPPGRRGSLPTSTRTTSRTGTGTPRIRACR